MKKADTKKRHKKAIFIILASSSIFTIISYIAEGKGDIIGFLFMTMLISALLLAWYFFYLFMRYYINCANEFIKSMKDTILSQSEAGSTKQHAAGLLWLYLLFRQKRK